MHKKTCGQGHGGRAEIEPMDARMAALERAAAETHGPVTPAGRDFRTTLDQTIRRGMPQRWLELRKATIHAFAEFQQMPTPRELRAMLVGNIVHAGAGGVSPDLGSLLAEFDARLLEQMRLAETAHLTEALARGKPPGAAFDEFASTHWHVPTPDRAFFGLRTVAQHAPTEQDILRRARDAHPGFAPKSPVNQDELHNLAARYTVAAYGEANSDRTAADALLGFNDHFPGALPPDPPTGGSGGFPGGFGGGGGGSTGSSPRPHPTAPRVGGGGGAAVAEAAGGAVRAERVAMARSFSRLVGFRRIGGVLIGRPPSAEPHLDFTGFDWQNTGQVKLTLKRGDGRNIVLGPFRPEIVHLAMACAADGRPITATMVTAAPLRELKILLHPALEDTAIGCRAIEVDRLVDRFAGSSEAGTPPSPREVESFRVQSFLELYHWAWAVTVTAGHDQVSKVAASPIANSRARSRGWPSAALSRPGCRAGHRRSGNAAAARTRRASIAAEIRTTRPCR